MQIDHDPAETPQEPQGMGLYWGAFVFLIALWASYLAFNSPDWWPIALGAGSGMFLATWAIEMTGNKAPSWMRR